MQLKKSFPDLRKGEEEIGNSRQGKHCTDKDSKGFFCSKKWEIRKSDHIDDTECRRYVNMFVSMVMHVWEVGRI